MYGCIKWLSRFIGILIFGGIAVGQLANATPKMDMQVEIDPRKQFLQATVKLSGLSGELGQVFYLNKDFKITSAKVNGKKSDFKFDLNGEPPPYVSFARPITFRGKVSTVELTYSGHIKDVIFDVNMISPELVELALYSAYFPFNSTQIPFFEYTLNLVLPKTLKVVTNGSVAKQSVKGNQHHYEIHSIGKSKDVPIIASPSFKLKTQTMGGLKAEMYYSPKGSKLVDGKIESMGLALKTFEKRFGKTGESGILRFAYSPRKGWGYSRLPLFVVSEERALEMLKNPFGKEKDIKGNVHELAHFWWSIADTNTNNDWINEGLAEYSAFSFSVQQYGEKFRQNVTQSYLEDIRKTKKKESIVNTTSESPDRYVNWYEKSALLFLVLEEKVGQKPMNAFLTELHTKFKGTRLATTEAFFEIAERHLNKDDFEFMKSYLTSSGWSNDQLKKLSDAGNFKDLL